jgi:osmotically-inducible protein OsmY
MMGQMGGQQQQQGQRQIRTKLVIGFQAPTVAPEVANVKVEALLNRGLELPAGSTVAVSMQGSTAVLRGSVNSEYDRGLAERLALLEPGIVAVQNELTVNLPAPTPEQ